MKAVSQLIIRVVLVLAFVPAIEAVAQEKKAMSLEDVMNFHQMQSQVINFDGQWVAYSAAPDRGDGYGVLVSADKKMEYTIERGENPRFSWPGNHVLFIQKPPLAKSEGNDDTEALKDAAILVSTSDGSQTLFDDVKDASFSTTGNYLFILHHNTPDTTLNKNQKDKLKKAGSPFLVKNLETNAQVLLPFVSAWTVDSLATTLVFTVKDTLNENNGLFFLSLNDLSSAPVVIDTTANKKFNRFTWYQKESRLAYLRAADMEKDTMETAELFSWQRMAGPEILLTQSDAPQGYFMPYDNNLTWSNDGERLFFGFRPVEHAASNEDNDYTSVLDSIRQQAEIDVWHGDDLLIKTHEKAAWNQISRQNLISVLHIGDRKVVQLAGKEITNVQPSANGKYVMASTIVPYSKLMTWEGRFSDLYVIDIFTGERQLVANRQSDLARMSPGSDYLLFFDKDNWHVYDIASGTTTNITKDLNVPFYDETNDVPAPPSSYRIAGWMEDGQSVLIYDRYDIWHANLSTGEIQSITAGEGRKSQTVFRIVKLDDEPLFKKREEVLMEGFNESTKVRALYSARPDRQGINLIMDKGKNLRLRLLSGNKKSIIYTLEAYDVYPDLWITSTKFRNPVMLSDLGNQTDSFNWGKAELVSFESAGGHPLQGVVIKPGDYDPSKKYPVFVYYYEQSSQRLHDFNQTLINHRPSFGYYASNGYVVFLPDIHFVEGRPGMSAVHSLVPGVQKLIDMGIADPGAIGLHGHSWSGYQTAYVVTQTDMFKAAIAGAPVSNMTSAYGGIRWGSGMARQFQYETGQSRIGFSLFEQPDLYIENSPLFYANKINTPMLLMHGDIDDAVPWEQSIELYLAMRRAGKDVIFLQYRDEPHHPQRYQNKVDYTIRMKEYFDYHLRGSDPPDWVINGAPYMGN